MVYLFLANPPIHESGMVECIESMKNTAVPAFYPVLAKAVPTEGSKVYTFGKCLNWINIVITVY